MGQTQHRMLLELGTPGAEGMDRAIVGRQEQVRPVLLDDLEQRLDVGVRVQAEVRHQLAHGAVAGAKAQRTERFGLTGDGAHAQAVSCVGAHGRERLPILTVQQENVGPRCLTPHVRLHLSSAPSVAPLFAG